LQSRRVQLAVLAARYTVPATYSGRDYAEAGGLMSYGANVTDASPAASSRARSPPTCR
jgi:putative ABC transport system substrate-binding protein